MRLDGNYFVQILVSTFDDNCQLLCFVLFMFRNATGSVMVASSFGMPPFAHEFRAVDAQPTRRRSIMNLWTVLASSTATHSVFFIAFNQYFKIESSNSIFKKHSKSIVLQQQCKQNCDKSAEIILIGFGGRKSVVSGILIWALPKHQGGPPPFKWFQ